MALEHKLFIDVDSSVEEIRELIYEGGLFEKLGEVPNKPSLINDRTFLSISEMTSLAQREFASGQSTDMRPTRMLYFRCRGGYENAAAWEEDVFVSVGVVLRAYPTADAYMLTNPDRTAFVRRAGKLTLSEDLAREGSHLDPKRYPHIGRLGVAFSVGPVEGL